MPFRVSHLTTVHPRDDIRIFRKECVSLAAAGYEVALIGPGEGAEVVDGVRLVALPRIHQRLLRATLGSLGAFIAALRERSDLYHFHDPELLPVGVLLRLCGKKVVFDAHENIGAQILTKPWIPRWLRRPTSITFRWFEAVTVRLLNAVVAATPAIAKQFPAGKTFVVQNFPLTGELAVERGPREDADHKRIVYVGGLSPIRGANNLVEAVGLVRDRDARLAIAGSFSSQSLESQVKTLPGWRRTEHRGWCDRQEVRELFTTAAAGVVTFLPAPNHIDSQPNKLFEYMSAGLPVIASDFPLWRSIVEGAGCGLLVDPTDPQSIADAIDWVLEHPREARAMGERGRHAVVEQHNWEREATELLAMYHRLLGRPHAQPPAEENEPARHQQIETPNAA